MIDQIRALLELAPAISVACAAISLAILVIALVLTSIRIIVGPTLADRVVALDMLVSIAIGLGAVTGLVSGFYLYVDISIALGLAGFLATVAFARFILAANHRAAPGREAQRSPAKSPPRIRNTDRTQGAAAK